MSIAIPLGYRRVNHRDDVNKLNAHGKLLELCTCGHTRSKHQGRNCEGNCSQYCDCHTFHWICWVIEKE